MLQYINLLLCGCKQKNILNEYECYILISAIYLHDIGIQITKNELLVDFVKKHGLDIGELNNDKASFIRKNHHLISSYIILQDINNRERTAMAFDGDVALGKCVAMIVESHGIDFSNKSSYNDDFVYRNAVIRVKLLSVLLCLADVLDCDGRRIDKERFRYSELPVVSRIHWMKHMYVKGVRIKNRIITISYDFPLLTECENNIYRSYFIDETQYWIRKIKTDYSSVLNDANLLFDIEESVEHNTYVLKLEDNDYDYIEGAVFDKICTSEDAIKYKTVSIGIVVKDNNVLMVKRKLPETSINNKKQVSVLEWQFPAGQVKTIDTPDKAIVREVVEETGIKCEIKEIIGKRLHPNTQTLCYYYCLIPISGEITNGDENENSEVGWIPLSDYKDKITSNVYWKVEEYLNKYQQRKEEV